MPGSGVLGRQCELLHSQQGLSDQESRQWLFLCLRAIVVVLGWLEVAPVQLDTIGRLAESPK